MTETRIHCQAFFGGALLCVALAFGAHGGEHEKIAEIVSRPDGLHATWLAGTGQVGVRVPSRSGCSIGEADWCVAEDGNVAFVWEESLTNRQDTDIYAQMFSADGAPLWPGGRTPVNLFRGRQRFPKVASAADGGVFVVWQSDSAGPNNINIWCQRLLPDGRAAWATPVPVCAYSGNQVQPAIAKDIDGSVLVAWEDYRHGNADVYGQRIEPDGSFTGPEDGVAVEAAPGDQTDVQFQFDDAGQAIAVGWLDHRKGFREPLKVETDISRMPIPEPALLTLLLPSLFFLLTRRSRS